MPAQHMDESDYYAKRNVPDTRGVSLEEEKIGYASDSAGESASSDETNLQGRTNTSRAPDICTDNPSRREGLAATTDEPTTPWKRAGIGDASISAPRNMPDEVPSFENQDITFGRLVSPNEGHVASGVEGDTTGGSSGPREGKDNTTSSGNIDSERAEAALLAGDSQGVYRDQNMRGDLPMSSWPPVTTLKRRYETARLRRRRGRIKFEARKVSRKRKGKQAYQGHGNAILHARKGIGTPKNLTIGSGTLQEGPEGAKKWRNVNTKRQVELEGQRTKARSTRCLESLRAYGNP
ncbi:hypothetical protein EDD17DRAFT_1868904 [Pisolithus thermaeus]|nr:hypothetical protein EDD17DRAFT_1868904 [Pisolithus thermaeus]